MSVPRPDDSAHGTVIGQIHIDDSISSKPVCELFYSSSGQITMGVERTRAGGELLFTNIANIPVGTTFTYEIRYESGQLSVAVNDGGFVQLSQYELANPNSYFKVGNYNQGNSYSEVRIQSISVSHGSKSSSTGSAHPVSTISAGGIGPREVIYALDSTVKPYASPTGACAAAPTKYSDSTVNLRLYYEDNCCHDVETAHIGTFNICHNSDGPFSSIEQAVGANLFDRGIHIVAYDGLDCTGGSTSLSLSNSKGCQAVSSGNGGYQSFMLSEPQTCPVTGPAIGSDNTVTMELYSDVGCCTTVETIKMGNTGTCHEADASFHSFSQAVGKNEFGWNIHIHTFTQSGCQGDYDSFSLSNAATCNKNGAAWKSFMIERDCARHDLDVKNDNTVSLALYRDGDCCVFNGEDIDLGTLGSCHNANDKFGSITQAVGQNMFGKDIHVQLFEGADCSGAAKDYSLTNKDGWCSAGGVNEEFQSFMIKKQCDTHDVTYAGDFGVSLAFWQDGDCCTYNQEEISVGRTGGCRNTEKPFGSVTQAVGQLTFGHDIHINVYEGQDCKGASKKFDLTNKEGWCSDGGVAEQYQSYSFAIDCGWKDPANSNVNTVTIETYTDVGCCTHKSETVIGVADTCHNAPDGGVAGLGIGAGSSWNGDILALYSEKDCMGDLKYFELSSALADTCAVTGGIINSWRLVKP
ncbi:alginate lyase-domain-containing protein [Aspergillus keveii]|uniref:Alginate lyase-domain-containing protein n=1 Tax=Aspergillus keveii TaxID=714993 RepID=A0ABR4FTT8_9EURO